jgi:hypothetical protein
MIRVAAKLALITALAATGVHFGYKQLEKKLLTSSCLPELPKNSRPEAATTLPAETAPIAAAQDFQIIVSRDIFQSPLATEKKQEALPSTTPQPLVPTALNLVLAGTVTGTEQTARAIIINNAGKDRKQQLLQIGDGVPGTGAVIKAIDWNSIKLDVNGKLEMLEMPKPKTAGPGPSVGLNPPVIPPEPEMGMDTPPEEEGENGRPTTARPNRRINLPPDSPTPDEPGEITEQVPVTGEPPVDEPTPPELPIIEETPPPELPPINAE